MRKRALKKRREELRELLADRREALGELVLGMHVQGVWDDGLLARGASEVREVEDGLAELDLETAPPTAEASEEVAETSPGADQEAPKEPRRRWGRKRGTETEVTEAEAAPPEGGSAGPEAPAVHPEFETAEHTAEHRLPTEPTPPPTPKAPRTREEPAPPAAPPAPEPSISAPEEPDAEAPKQAPEPPLKETKPAESAPAPPKPPAVRPSPPSPSPAAKAPEAGPSPLDALERRLEQEEREARTAVETAKASAGAESGTEVASLMETLQSDRQSLDQALAAASTRISDADRQAGEASERAARLEAENREAAARWVREQAADIEADAAVAAEMAGPGTGGAPSSDDARVRDLETELDRVRSQLEEERQEKTKAIETAEARVREIEERASRVESAEEGGNGDGAPNAAELREAAVGWLRGQIVALRREIEAAERKGKGDS